MLDSNHKQIHWLDTGIFKILAVFTGTLIPGLSARAQSAFAGDHPVGGSAPVDGAAFLLIAMGIAYGIKKVSDPGEKK